MAAENKVTFSLRVWINKETDKVLFAEVDRHFADTLISFLTLPLGTIVRLLTKQYGDETPVIGSLNTLYQGLENLDVCHFWNEAGKQMLLNPKNTFEAHIQKLKLNVDDTEPTKYFICKKWDCQKGKDSISASMHCGTKCECGLLLELGVRLTLSCENEVGPGVFTGETASFILGDDLQMMPNLVDSGLQILRNLGINGTYGIEEKTVVIGYQEVMDLLKGSLISKTPLTDLIIQKTQRIPHNIHSKFSSKAGINATTFTTKKITVKAIVQRSTRKILLTQTSGDFVDFLFGLLAIPLGGVLSLLGGDSSFGSIHNLYGSLESLNSDSPVHIATSNGILTKTTIMPFYIIRSHLYLVALTTSFVVKDPKEQESFVKLPVMFAVTDDLIVKPASAILGLSTLNSLNIPIQDIEERTIDIGMKEALSILNASLFSKSALNDGLRHLLLKQPKEEK